MSILVLSGYDDFMKEVGDRCTPTHRRYAELNGYAHEVVRNYIPDLHPSHQKIRIIRERIAQYSAILWLDADTVVMNMGVPLPCNPIGTVMDISVDWCAPPEHDDGAMITTNMVSCGNFIIWSTPHTALFMDQWELHSEAFASLSTCCWEQDGLKAAMAADPFIDLMVNRWHRRAFNSVHPTCATGDLVAPKPYQQGDFLLHLTNVDRLSILDQLGL